MSKAENTRLNILRRSLELIYKQGYQSTSIDDILAKTQVTKGAFYYHFKNKEEMGIALINEAIHNEIWPHIVSSLSSTSDSSKNLYEMIKRLLFEHPFMTVEHGCPGVNLIQEMAPLSESFRKALLKSLNKWRKAIETEIIRGQEAGQIDVIHDAKQIALNIITLYHGGRNMGKMLGVNYYISFLNQFQKYLDTLK